MAKDPSMFGDKIYFVTLTVVGWTDVFIRSEYRQFLVENLEFCVQKKGLDIYAFCLMTNHLHMIVGSRTEPVQDVLRHFKSYTGKKLLSLIAENPRESRREWLADRFSYFAKVEAQDTQRQFWERNSYPQEVKTDAFFLQKQQYIHSNPVRSGFVARAEEWWFSSANPECPLTICDAAA